MIMKSDGAWRKESCKQQIYVVSELAKNKGKNLTKVGLI